MEEHQQRRLEIVKTCLNNLEKYFVGSQCATNITEAQVQLDKLLLPEGPVDVVPLSPSEVVEAIEGRLRPFPPGLLVWINNELVESYEPKTGDARIVTDYAPTYDGGRWLTLETLRRVYGTRGWDVRQVQTDCFVFSKRDEKQASSIN